MARAVEARSDLVVLTSDNPRTEDPEAIVLEVLDGFERPHDVHVKIDRAEAIRAALADAEPGDCVLLAGKGHERWQIIGREKVPFDDAEVARDWLYGVRPYAEVSS
jgi:UDP-N-acetylmuramoyl-L-alanyl-D-glutamate--2,6-diaminopimelate ligase